MKKINCLHLFSLLILVLFLGNCQSGGSNKEAQKLLQKQKDLQTSEQQNLEGTKTNIEGTLTEIGQLEDSLAITRNQITSEQQKLKTDVTQLALEKLRLQEERQNEARRILQTKIDSVNNALASTNVSLNKAVNETASLSSDKDSLTAKSGVVSNLDSEVREKLVTGIKEIDSKMEALNKEKRNFQSQVTLSQQKANVAKRKIEVLKSEQELYENQKAELFDNGAPQSEIDAVAKMITTVEQNIELEQQKLKTTNHAIEIFNESIAAIEKQRAGLSENVRKQYTTKEVIEEFMKEEQKRLAGEVVRLDTLQKQRTAEAEAIAKHKIKLEENLTGLQEKGVKFQEEKMVVLESQKAELEKQMLALNQQEQDLGVTTSTPKGAPKTVELEKEFKMRQEALAKERDELAKEKEAIAAQETATKEKRKASKKKASNIIFYILGFGIVLLGGLYIVGKNRKKKTKPAK